MSNPVCPYCHNELAYDDYFGPFKFSGPYPWIEKKGEIFKCANESCEMFDEFFYVYDSDNEIHEGYPC